MVIARGAAPADHRILLGRLELPAAEQRRVLVGLEVAQPQDHRLGMERGADGADALRQLVDEVLRLVLVSVGDALDLRPQRPCSLVLAPGPFDPLQEFVRGEPAIEFLAADEVVLAAVLLPGPALARRRGHRQLQLGDALEKHLRKGALPLAGGAGDDEDGRAFTC